MVLQEKKNKLFSVFSRDRTKNNELKLQLRHFISECKRLPAAAAAAGHCKKLPRQTTAVSKKILADTLGEVWAELGKGRLSLTVSSIHFVKRYKNSRKLWFQPLERVPQSWPCPIHTHRPPSHCPSVPAVSRESLPFTSEIWIDLA